VPLTFVSSSSLGSLFAIYDKRHRPIQRAMNSPLNPSEEVFLVLRRNRHSTAQTFCVVAESDL
jgi:hypothetical protein